MEIAIPAMKNPIIAMTVGNAVSISAYTTMTQDITPAIIPAMSPSKTEWSFITYVSMIQFPNYYDAHYFRLVSVKDSKSR